MPEPTPAPRDVLAELARSGFITARRPVESLVLGDTRVTGGQLDALDAHIAGLDALVVAAAHRADAYSVDRTVATVLSDSVRADRFALQHAAKLLRSIHGPQPEAVSKACGEPVTVWAGDECIRHHGHDGDHVCDRGLRRAPGADLLADDEHMPARTTDDA